MTVSAEVVSIDPVPPPLTNSSGGCPALANSCSTARTIFPRRVASSRVEMPFITETAGELSVVPAICPS